MIRLNFNEVYDIICRNDSLKVIFNWYIRHCESLSLPYHNMSHTLGMMLHIYRIYEESQYKNKKYGFKLSDTDLYILLVSALFHDYNHSGGKFSDKVNVNIAIAGLKECLDETVSDGPQKEYLFSNAEEIIRATEFPYVIADEELTVNQRIIREADILVCFYDDYVTHNTIGIYSEMGETEDIAVVTAKYIQFILNSLKNLKLVYSKEVIEVNQESFFQTIDLFSKIFNKEK